MRALYFWCRKKVALELKKSNKPATVAPREDLHESASATSLMLTPHQRHVLTLINPSGCFIHNLMLHIRLHLVLKGKEHACIIQTMSVEEKWLVSRLIF